MDDVIAAHERWVERVSGGRRGNLCQQAFPGADLSGRCLIEIEARDVDWSGAKLRGANLARADLRFASLRTADLRDADLSNSLLDFASLADADLSGARFVGASLHKTALDNVRMSWFDHTLLGERLWRAAGDNLELRMLAAYVGHTKNFCWDDHRDLPPRYRRWILNQFTGWWRENDEAPPLLVTLAATNRNKPS